jgi:hypothetical protein
MRPCVYFEPALLATCRPARKTWQWAKRTPLHAESGCAADKLAALDLVFVVAGHKRPELSNDPHCLVETS